MFDNRTTHNFFYEYKVHTDRSRVAAKSLLYSILLVFFYFIDETPDLTVSVLL